MVTPHKHELAATYLMGIVDYDTIKMGCHECGPQWVVTLDWVNRTFYVSWVNLPWAVYFDSRRGSLDVHAEPSDA